VFAANTEADITSDLDNYVSYNKSIINYVNHRLHKYTFFVEVKKLKIGFIAFFGIYLQKLLFGICKLARLSFII
jgi:hypothetical protein